jgi:vitamin B12 transporter
MNPNPSARRLVLRLLSLAAATVGSPALHSQAVPDGQLPTYVVVATRTPEDVRTLGSSADVVTPGDLEREDLESAADALGLVPGITALPNGARGSDVSVFTRGADSDQTLFLVDGIRLNDANTDYAVVLGGSRLGATDTIEVARGPQSTLYGSEAVGGVVSIEAQKGSGDPSSELILGAGSFDSASASLSAQGARDGWAWSLTGSGSHTANDRPNNAFDGANLVLRVDRDLVPGIAVGATLRGFDGRYGDPGDIYTNDPYAWETESNWLGTVFADLKPAPDWTARITLGGQDRRYVSFDELPGVYSETTLVENRRGIVDSQATFSGLAGQRLTAGFTAEAETTRDNGYGDIDQRQTLFAAFTEDQWHPAEGVYLTAGFRFDDFDTFGNAETGRVTAAWLSPGKLLKLRASAGTGFNAPSFLELYGVSTGYSGDPDLKPERSRGGDAGIDLYLPGASGTLSATFFRTDTSNLIVYDFSVYPGTTANVGRARSDGVELELKWRPAAGLECRASYTYLDASDLTDGTRLLRRPRNSGSAEVWKDLGGGWSAGAGLVVVAGREDVDAQTFLTVDDPDYAVFRLTSAWKATPRLTVRARVENLLNKKYAPVNGYPALGAGAFGEVVLKL